MVNPSPSPLEGHTETGALQAERSMTSGEQLIGRLRSAAHTCEATGELWGRAWATWLRTLIVLGCRHDPRLIEIRRIAHRAAARGDWQAVLAISSEHNPSPWGRRD